MCSGRFLPGIMRLGLEADHSPPSNTKFKNEWRYTSTSTHAFMARTVTIILSLCMAHILTCIITKVKKVKCTLVQTLRLCTGRTAHRESRCIAILFLNHGTRREWEVSVTPRPHFTPGKGPVPIVQVAGWAPWTVWTCAENLTPTGIRSPDRSARSQLLYRLRYPAPRNHRHMLIKAFPLTVTTWWSKSVGIC